VVILSETGVDPQMCIRRAAVYLMAVERLFVVRVLERPGHSNRGSRMDRIKRIAAATAVSTVVLAPTTAGLAFARPDPGPAPQASSLSEQYDATKAHFEWEERQLQMPEQRSDAIDGQSASSTGADTEGFPWETAGLAALAGAVITGGGVALVRRFNHEPRHA
jgi:hypothetical protein